MNRAGDRVRFSGAACGGLYSSSSRYNIYKIMYSSSSRYNMKDEMYSHSFFFSLNSFAQGNASLVDAFILIHPLLHFL